MTIIAFLWLVNAALQAGAALFCFRQMFWPYRWPQWQWAWGTMTLAMVSLCVRRLYTALWGYVDLPGLEVHYAHLELGIACLNSALLVLGLWQFSDLFPASAVLPVTAPASIVMDAQSVVLTWDATAEILFGWSKAEMEGHSITCCIPARHQPQHLSGVQRRVSDAVPEATPPVIITTTALHRDGTEIPVQLEVTHERCADGTLRFHALMWRLIRI